MLYYDQEEMFGYKVPDRNKLLTNINQSKKPENEPLRNVKKQETENFKGTPYSEIIKEFWKQVGGEPVEGERNAKLHKLAYHLGPITIIM